MRSAQAALEWVLHTLRWIPVPARTRLKAKCLAQRWQYLQLRVRLLLRRHHLQASWLPRRVPRQQSRRSHLARRRHRRLRLLLLLLLQLVHRQQTNLLVDPPSACASLHPQLHTRRLRKEDGRQLTRSKPPAKRCHRHSLAWPRRRGQLRCMIWLSCPLLRLCVQPWQPAGTQHVLCLWTKSSAVCRLRGLRIWWLARDARRWVSSRRCRTARWRHGHEMVQLCCVDAWKTWRTPCLR